MLIDPFALEPAKDENLGELLRAGTGTVPLVSLLASDSPEVRRASLQLGANAVLTLENVGRDLLPLLRGLLNGNRLASGVEDYLRSATWNSKLFGRPSQRTETELQKLALQSQATVARLAPALPAENWPETEKHSPDSSLFLKGLALEPAAGSVASRPHITRTACSPNCGNHFCGLQVHVRDGKAVKIEPADFPDRRYRHLCLKGISHLQTVSHPERLLYPLKRQGPRGSGNWVRLSWKQALDEIYARAQTIRQQYGPQSFMFFPYSGQISAINGMMGSYLRLASLWGASGTDLFAFGVDSAVPSGIEETFGRGTGYLANDYTDLVNTRTLLIWGANPIYSRMNWWPFFTAAHQAGCQIITIDPKFSATAAKSDEWLPVRPGSDLYLALGLIHLLIHQDLYDRDFLRQHTSAPLLVDPGRGRYLRLPDPGRPGNPETFAVLDPQTGQPVPAGSLNRPALAGKVRYKGSLCQPAFALLAEMVAPYTPRLVAEKTGLPTQQIKRLAQALAEQRPARIFTLYGVDRWHHGATFGRLIGMLAALTGNLGRPGAGAGVDGFSDGILYISSFMNPDGLSYQPVNAAELPGYILKQEPYPIRGVLVALNNWFNQWPDQNRLKEEILPALDLLVCSDLFMTETARYADYVLPAAHFFEREDLVHGPKPYVQLQSAVLKPPGECRSDFEIAAGLALRSGHGAYFDRPPRAYLQDILDENPQTAGITVEQLEEQGPLPQQLINTSAVAHVDLQFDTTTGRVEFFSERLAPYGHGLPVYEPPIEADLNSSLAERYPFVCITEHSRYRVHSAFGNVPWLRELEDEPCALINPKAAEIKGLQDGQPVRIFNERGFVVMKARLNQAVPPRAVYVTQGWQSSDFANGHTQSLTHNHSNPLNILGPNASFSDVLVDLSPLDTIPEEAAQ